MKTDYSRMPQAYPRGGSGTLRIDCDGEIMGPAHRARRAEVDEWLQEVGAVVIQVEDLGAALEARERGGEVVWCATLNATLPPRPETVSVLDLLDYSDPAGVAAEATTAAHLARVALGEVGR